MRWLPSITAAGATICDRQGEAEGVYIQLRWGRLVIQYTVCRFPKDGESRDAW